MFIQRNSSPMILISTVAQKCHGNFNLLTTISISLTATSICSRQFQFHSRQFQHTHGNFNLFTAISIYSRHFQFVHGNFNLLTAISICSRQFQFYSRHFQFFHGNAHGIFRFAHHLSATLALHQSQNAKSKVDI